MGDGGESRRAGRGRRKATGGAGPTRLGGEREDLPQNWEFETREELLEKVRESEEKRLKLAEALHVSQQRMRNIPAATAEDERALPYGVYVRPGKEPGTAVIKVAGRLYEAKVLSHREQSSGPAGAGILRSVIREKRRNAFSRGELLLLNNDLQVVEPRGYDLFSGAVGTVQQVLSDEKLLLGTVGEESLVVNRAQPLMSTTILTGDSVEYDPQSHYAYTLVPKDMVDRLTLEKVPDITFRFIGGLADAIELIQDAIELPHLYPEYFLEHRLVPPKGILLYGPPGCGKTLIAKAVANSLAHRIEEKTGEKGESYFINVKGPELLSKYVGETERAIRDVFTRARSQASYRSPVVIMFDEMDSMFRVRGSGISSDMESTIVPQFLAELDGLESLENVIVIGATNREDLIDPAVLRPGRLDRKIRIPRRDQASAAEIFSKYLVPELPLDTSLVEAHGGAANAVAWVIGEVTEEMYRPAPENQLLEVAYADGSREILYFRDFASGAIIENIVSRAKLAAVKDLIGSGRKGLTLDHLRNAMREEYQENEDLPRNTNPAEWYRILGMRGERVVRVRSLLAKDREPGEDSNPIREVVEVSDALE
ncbi:MAG: proteasome ATPase [Deferrisomatales bacterium]|nr:proteasome ATPase [Deferrisomatales bacterium]